MQIQSLDLRSLHKCIKAEMVDAITRCIDSSRFVGADSIADFEKSFADYIGCRCAVGVNSGTDALYLSLLAMGVTHGDCVVTTANSFVSTVSAILRVGAEPLFADVEPHNGLMDVHILRRLLNSHPRAQHIKAVIPVHLWGQCATMGAIASIAQEYGLMILEDACQAHGSSFQGIKAGAWGDLGAFSFYPGKNLGGIGDGGIITINREDYLHRLLSLRDCGRSSQWVYENIGINSRLDVIQAEVLGIKLKHLDKWNCRRRQIANLYFTMLRDCNNIGMIDVSNPDECCYHQFVVKVPDRPLFIERLRIAGVDTNIHYPIPLHLQPCFRNLNYKQGDLPNTEQLCNEIVSLPIDPCLADQEVCYIADAILNIDGDL